MKVYDFLLLATDLPLFRIFALAVLIASILICHLFNESEKGNAISGFAILIALPMLLLMPQFRTFALIMLITSITLYCLFNISKIHDAISGFALLIALLMLLLIPQIIWIKVATLFVPFITHPAAMFCLIFLYIAGAMFLVVFLLYWLYIQSLNLCSCISK